MVEDQDNNSSKNIVKKPPSNLSLKYLPEGFNTAILVPFWGPLVWKNSQENLQNFYILLIFRVNKMSGSLWQNKCL